MPSKELYKDGKDIEDIKTSDHTWRGYTATSVGYPIAVLFTEDGDEPVSYTHLSNTSSAGTKAYPVYSNGKTWIAKAYGETYMDTKIFSTEEGKSIGFTYVKEE